MKAALVTAAVLVAFVLTARIVEAAVAGDKQCVTQQQELRLRNGRLVWRDDGAARVTAGTCPAVTPAPTASPTATPAPTASPTPAPTASPTPAPTATVTPVPTATPPGTTTIFIRTRPKTALLSGNACAALVKPRAENIPDNNNFKVIPPPTLAILDGVDSTTYPATQNYNGRIDGAFLGSTDETIQWAACKWGLDENDLRAKAYVESSWRQRTINPDGEYSVGLMQVNQEYHVCLPANPRGGFCLSSMSYNADYAAAWQRACVDGGMTWLGGDYLTTVTNAAAGSLTALERIHTGCIGVWYSGEWYTGKGGTGNTFDEYIAEWRARRQQHPTW